MRKEKSSIKPKTLVLGLLLCICILAIGGCRDQQLDEYGGYYNEKTGKYKYVKPSKKGIDQYELKPRQLRPREQQSLSGVISKIEPDAKSVWITIKDRRSYQMLAEDISMGNRNDKDKQLKINFKYVAPLVGLPANPSLQKEWKRYVHQVLEQELLNEKVSVTIDYQAKSRSLWGEVFKIIQAKEGFQLRMVNRWMILKGYSFYIFSPLDKEPRNDLLEAQRLAKNRRAGVWNYQ